MHRKILKVKTVGSRATGNLRPAISDFLLRGVNMAVLEYDEPNAEAVVEVFGSSNPLVENPISEAALETLKLHESVVEELPSHPSAGGHKFCLDKAKVTVDETEKTVSYEGKTASYKRIEKGFRGEDLVVIDEC